MIKHFWLTSLFCLASALLLGQADSGGNSKPDVFTRLTTAMKGYKPDTSAAPPDRLTRAIMELRNLRGGFNINEAIEFKIAEDRQKGDLPGAQGDSLALFFTTGNGRRWLDNAVIRIYRDLFSYTEVRQLIRFYKKPAGQKLAGTFPLIMLQSLVAAEMIKGGYAATKSAK